MLRLLDYGDFSALGRAPSREVIGENVAVGRLLGGGLQALLVVVVVVGREGLPRARRLRILQLRQAALERNLLLLARGLLVALLVHVPDRVAEDVVLDLVDVLVRGRDARQLLADFLERGPRRRLFDCGLGR